MKTIPETERILKLMDLVKVFREFSKELKTDHKITYHYDKDGESVVKGKTWVDIDGVQAIHYGHGNDKRAEREPDAVFFHLATIKPNGRKVLWSSHYYGHETFDLVSLSSLIMIHVFEEKSYRFYAKKEKELKKYENDAIM